MRECLRLAFGNVCFFSNLARQASCGFLASFLWRLFIFNNLASFVLGSFWLLFPQPSFVFNNFLASFLKKRILFSSSNGFTPPFGEVNSPLRLQTDRLRTYRFASRNAAPAWRREPVGPRPNTTSILAYSSVLCQGNSAQAIGKLRRSESI